MQAVDCHTHAFAPRQIRQRGAIAARDPVFAEMYGDARARMVTPAETVAQLQRDGFAGALMAGFAFTSLADCEEQNEALLACARERGQSFAALASLNPAKVGWERVASRALDLGAVGFGELRPRNQGWDPLGPSALRFYEWVKEAGLVLMWHASEPVGHSYPGKQGGIAPAELYSVAVRFPAIPQIAAHLGAGLPFFLQMPEVRESLANVYFDTAATSLLYDDSAVARVVDLAGRERVLFGSDYPLLSPRRHLERVSRAIKPETAPEVCGGNLRGMLGRQWK